MRFIDPDGNTLWDVVKGVGKGIFKAVVSNVKGIAKMVDQSPARQAERAANMASIIKNPKQSVENIKQNATNAIQEANRDKSGGKWAELITNVVAQGAIAFVTTKGINGLTKVGTATEIANATRGGLAEIANAAEWGKAIVIGEGMGAVKTTAKTLQSQGINAKWYQAWSKNFPTNRLMTPAEMDAALARDARWLNTKINQGYKIYDIGIDVTRTTRSPFYQLEQSILQQRVYPTTKIPR